MRVFKKFALLLGMTMSAFCLFSLGACDGTDNPSGNPPSGGNEKVVEITVGILKEESEQAVGNALKTAFEQKYGTQKYSVKLVEIDGNYNVELLKMYRKGELPDVCVAFGDSVDYWSARGVFLPITQYVVQGGVNLNGFIEDVAETIALEATGQTYWLPNSFEKRVMYFNKDVLEKAGVALPANGQWTWSALTEFADTVYASDKTVYPIGLDITNPSFYAPVFKNHNVALGKDGVAFNGEQTDIYACLEWLSGLANSGLTADGQETTIENTAVWVGTRADLPTYLSADIDFALAAMPSADNGNAYAGYTVSGFAMSQDCPQEERQAAWDFIQYAASEEGQQIAGKTGYVTPTLKTLMAGENAEWRKFAPNIANETFIADSAKDVNSAFLQDCFSEERQLSAYEEYKTLIGKLKEEALSDAGKTATFFEENGTKILASKYELDTYTLPVWEGNTVYYESAMIVGAAGEIVLSDVPENVIGVYDYGLQTKYVEGVDYTVDGNVIKRISRGSMPYADMSYVYSDTPAGVSIKVEPERCPDYDYDGATEYLTYGEKDTYTRKQIVVTYTRTNGWQGEIPEGKRDRFSKLNAKLEAGEDVNIVVYGDSISEGCNASGTSYGGNVAPYADSWADMVTKKLAKDYGANVRLRNVALGGKATDWATQNFDERVLSEDADLLILGFGMNDGGTSVDTYRERIEEMVGKFRQHNPDGEVLLLAPMLPNVESTWLKNQPLFAEELYTLEDKYGYAAVADMTAMHWELLNMGKRYRDMTGNNINHPNDFMVRIYGQVILHTLLNSQA